jgi:hypothetical protein
VFDTCCRGCAVSGGAGAHDPACEQRWQQQQQQGLVVD